jgi:hypothetical protein
VVGFRLTIGGVRADDVLSPNGTFSALFGGKLGLIEEVEVLGPFDREPKGVRRRSFRKTDLNLEATIFHALLGWKRIRVHFLFVSLPVDSVCEELARPPTSAYRKGLCATVVSVPGAFG